MTDASLPQDHEDVTSEFPEPPEKGQLLLPMSSEHRQAKVAELAATLPADSFV